MTIDTIINNKDVISSYGRSVFTMGKHTQLGTNPEKYFITEIKPEEEENFRSKLCV
ncbi:MAG: hypothetical protein MZU97_02590 [Bacillus subtilis]|nr:hypothetical protein [Bacillus subtilis]